MYWSAAWLHDVSVARVLNINSNMTLRTLHVFVRSEKEIQLHFIVSLFVMQQMEILHHRTQRSCTTVRR